MKVLSLSKKKKNSQRGPENFSHFAREVTKTQTISEGDHKNFRAQIYRTLIFWPPWKNPVSAPERVTVDLLDKIM